MASKLLQFASAHAGLLRKASAASVAVVAIGLLIVGPAQWWFTWIGRREAEALVAAQRAAVIQMCKEERGENARALVDQESGALICASRDLVRRRKQADVGEI